MKKNNIISTLLILSIIFSGCENSILDKSPLDRYSDAVLWSDISLVNAYLLDCYQDAPNRFNQRMLSSYTDETQTPHGKVLYVNGEISPESPERTMWNPDFVNIQKINIFLSRIDEVPNAYPESQQSAIEKRVNVLKGEALFLRAFCYADLARNYGGVPLFKEPAKLGAEFNTIERSTFSETVQFIAEDCDAAAALLSSKGQIDLGRATKGAALTLKSRILLFAASDLTADGSAKNKFVGYENPDRNALWKKAKDAAKAVIDLDRYELEDFGAPDKSGVSQGYFDFFSANTLSSDEIIWGKMYSLENGDRNRMNNWNGANGLDGWATNSPTQNLVDAYQMDDGTDFFENFNIDDNSNYVNVSGKYSENPYIGRDPRFYGSILYDSAVWKKRLSPTLQARDPLGIYDRRTRITIKNGEETSVVFGIDTPQGPTAPWNASLTGYIYKKFLQQDRYFQEADNDNCWIEMRYAEVLLNYAEASIGLGEDAEAAIYINKIRNRAAMPDFSGDITSALRYERHIELVFEDSRFYDMRRWKILDLALTDAMGIDIVETTTDGITQTTWKQIKVEERSPDQDFKIYWIPIPADEIKRAPQLMQNPGY